MKKHFVIYYSPGTFVAEQSIRPIDSWDTIAALEMAKEIKERYDSRPYGFCFITKERGEEDLDAEETERSGMYYIVGKIKTLEEIKQEHNPENRILISNMECNHWDRVVETCTPWKSVHPLEKGDVVLVSL